MANEIQYRHVTTGETLYSIIEDVDGTIYDVASSDFTGLVVSDWDEYNLPLVETPASSFRYLATFPAIIAAGKYTVSTFVQDGGVPAVSDIRHAQGDMEWDGTIEITLTAYKDSIASDTWVQTERVITGGGAVGSLKASDVWSFVNRELTARSDFDIGKIFGDSDAASDFLLMLDGSGGATLTLAQLRVDASNADGGVYVTNSGGPAVQNTGTTYGVKNSATATSGIGLSNTSSGATGIGMLSKATGGSNSIGASFDSEGVAGVGISVVGEIIDIRGNITGNLSGSVGSVITVSDISEDVFKRSMSDVNGSAAPHSIYTMVQGALESRVDSDVWRIFRTDGTTTHAVKSITSDSAANPIVGVT